ncbi:hypothetical protein Scep_023218 [Stephania cephalantha]|uniref:Uncharacterized protein n=1 Tax=Stephania cephalantha TaxID=152367 RepID=A0AAP0F1C8_9MAGN
MSIDFPACDNNMSAQPSILLLMDSSMATIKTFFDFPRSTIAPRYLPRFPDSRMWRCFGLRDH